MQQLFLQVILWMGFSRRFQIVRDKDFGHTTNILIQIHMGADPTVLFHVKKGFHVGVLTVRECPDKQVGGDWFTGV